QWRRWYGLGLLHSRAKGRFEWQHRKASLAKAIAYFARYLVFEREIRFVQPKQRPHAALHGTGQQGFGLRAGWEHDDQQPAAICSHIAVHADHDVDSLGHAILHRTAVALGQRRLLQTLIKASVAGSKDFREGVDRISARFGQTPGQPK